MRSAATAKRATKDTKLACEEGRPCAGLLVLAEKLTRFVFLARGCHVASENAEFAGGLAHLGEGVVEAGGVFRLEVNEELILPGAAVNRAALDLEQIHPVLRKRLERGKQGAGAMGESHGQGSFAGPVRLPRRSFFPRYQKNETREILGVVLDAFGKNQAAIMFRGAAPGDGSPRFISRRN